MTEFVSYIVLRTASILLSWPFIAADITGKLVATQQVVDEVRGHAAEEVGEPATMVLSADAAATHEAANVACICVAQV